MNLIAAFWKAHSRCRFPNMDKWKFIISMHHSGHGQHRLTTVRNLQNMDEMSEGHPININHTADFTYEDACKDMFFEKLLFQVYAEFEVHEVFENFECDEARLYNPHKVAWHRRKDGLHRSEWRNGVLWDAVGTAMEHLPPKLSNSDKMFVWEYNLGVKFKDFFRRRLPMKKMRIKSVFRSWVNSMKDLKIERDSYIVWRKIVFTAWSVDQVLHQCGFRHCHVSRTLVYKVIRPLYDKVFTLPTEGAVILIDAAGTVPDIDIKPEEAA
jgi:hypothetical protein